MAEIALGTYRMSDSSPDHVAAIRMAVESGVCLIDTSTNYMDGGAERAIGRALATADPEAAAKVEVVSKFGYLQGTTLKRHLDTEHFNDVVVYADHVYHSINADFMRDQLAHSLQRLGRTQLDCYLLHNPEYYLLDAAKRGVRREERLDIMLERIYDAFVALEQEVAAGRIRSYGVSSNGFSEPGTSDGHLPYEDLVSLAHKAARYAGNDAHAFTTLQFPLNLLERDGEACAVWAKGKGLRVLANRPLNAQRAGRMYRLADYDEPREYYHHLNALLGTVGEERELQPLYNLVNELDRMKHRFGWIGDYEQFFQTQVVPLLRQAFEGLTEEAQALLAASMEPFLEAYGAMVRHECARNTRRELASEFGDCPGTMQECAVDFLKGLGTVDFILLGMRRPAYIAEFTGIT